MEVSQIMKAYTVQKESKIRFKTQLQKSVKLSEKYKANIYLKREDQQVVRIFKMRGVYNKFVSLSEEEKKKPLLCPSDGNHAQAFAYFCNHFQVKGKFKEWESMAFRDSIPAGGDLRLETVADKEVRERAHRDQAVRGELRGDGEVRAGVPAGARGSDVPPVRGHGDQRGQRGDRGGSAGPDEAARGLRVPAHRRRRTGCGHHHLLQRDVSQYSDRGCSGRERRVTSSVIQPLGRHDAATAEGRREERAGVAVLRRVDAGSGGEGELPDHPGVEGGHRERVGGQDLDHDPEPLRGGHPRGAVGRALRRGAGAVQAPHRRQERGLRGQRRLRRPLALRRVQGALPPRPGHQVLLPHPDALQAGYPQAVRPQLSRPPRRNHPHPVPAEAHPRKGTRYRRHRSGRQGQHPRHHPQHDPNATQVRAHPPLSTVI